MQKLLYIMCFYLAAGCAPKKTTHAATAMTDSATMHTPINEEATTVANDPVRPPKLPPRLYDESGKEIPPCIVEKMKAFEEAEVQNPPRKIYSYNYQGKTVYYFTAVCCDQYSDLYDAGCNILGHPDGGFTGRGDGKFSDFSKEASARTLVWEDKRTK